MTEKFDNNMRRFITLFDSLGFESIIDITNDEKNDTLKILKGENPDNRASELLHMMTLRARFNPQRNPEIWVFESDISEKVLYEYSQEYPQQLADLIRKKGVKAFGSKGPDIKIT